MCYFHEIELVLVKKRQGQFVLLYFLCHFQWDLRCFVSHHEVKFELGNFHYLCKLAIPVSLEVIGIGLADCCFHLGQQFQFLPFL
jgi:hypothetical protein